ncbi:MAG: hypothetical protein J6B30_09045 [Muribaculaceae bacterium]|nr:hypothetical protein [Muribaculaceae bacterium]MBR3831974.1 hypothetical protein [Muribaculaceae bacterium]
MKKLFSLFAVAVLCISAISCSDSKKEESSNDVTEVGKFEMLKQSLKDKDWTAADSVANLVYEDKENCNARELANVALVYFVLAEQTDDINAKQQLEYINRAIECSDEAEKADEDEANDTYEKAGKDIKSLKKKYQDKLSDYEKEAKKTIE